MMPSKTLCRLVRVAVIGVALCGIAACFYFLPSFGANIVNNYPDYSHYYLPWLIFLWLSATPCFVFLVLIWKISTAIKSETVFTLQTARLIKTCAVILFCDVGFFFLGNIIFMLLGLNHSGVLLLSAIVNVFGVTVAVLVAVLSRYITKAAALQEEADGTI